MADVKISAMTEATSVADADLFNIVQGGVNKKVTKANLGVATEADLQVMQDNIALNTLRSQIDAGWAYLNMVDGIADEYEDETGVNTGSTDFPYNATTDRYVNSVDADLMIKSETTDGSTTFTDSGDNGFTITAVGDVEHSTTQAKFGSSAISFDGTGDYLTVPDNDIFAIGTNDFTFECWVYHNNFTGTQNYYGQWGTSTALQLRVTSTTIVCYYDGVSNLESGAHGMSTNTWHHVAMTRSGSTFRIYIDGSAVATNSSFTGDIPNDNVAVSIGASGASNYFNGYMEEIRFINGTAAYSGASFTVPTTPIQTAATATLISQPFTAEFVPTTARALILHENIDGGTLNTDFIVSISRDGGATYTALTLEDQGVFQGAIDILSSASEDISGQPSGSSIVYRVQSLNSTAQAFDGIWIQWG